MATKSNAYCLFCRTGCEHHVVRYLRDRAGVEAYFPRRKVREMRGGVWTTAQKPLLPGYVFAFATEADEPALSVHPDVLRILQYADKHRALVGGDLAFARWIQDHGGTIGISKAYFDEGQRIVIASGPLSDYHGKILRIDKRKQRALVELDFAGRQQTVSLSFDYLKENNEAG